MLIMKTLCVLLIVIGTISIDAHLAEEEFPPAFFHLISKVRKHCLDSFPISETERENARMGNFDDNDTEMKKYVTCLFTKSGFTDKSLHMNKALLNAFIPKVLKEGNGVEMIIECSDKAREKLADHPFEDKVWDMLKCMYHGDPVLFSAFYPTLTYSTIRIVRRRRMF
ncbi:unnamed protein product [Phaedon cochleariae]|uniref:Uncharacterized protein n=1 Tax=Phaedon cochleariae TaxID=80249 RepID=A0A9P0DQJ5_PHACE|nr:unnamed protein product [Phaedon cochleariae]